MPAFAAPQNPVAAQPPPAQVVQPMPAVAAAAPAMNIPPTGGAAGPLVQPAPAQRPSGANLGGSAPQRPELRTDNFGADAGASTAQLVTILKDGSEGPTYRIVGEATDIGRAEGNVLLPDDPYLSPRHARITLRGGRCYLRDLGSVNGVFYRIRDGVELHHGDVVLAGQQLLRVEILTDADLSFGPVMHYGVMVFGTPEQPRLARLVQLTTEGIPRDVFHLYRDETVLGRESGDIVFTDDAFMSRRHAAFKLDRAQRRVVLRDLQSSNGTLVQFRGEREINDGDVFRIGHHLFRFDVAPRPVGGGPNGGSPAR